MCVLNPEELFVSLYLSSFFSASVGLSSACASCQ